MIIGKKQNQCSILSMIRTNRIQDTVDLDLRLFGGWNKFKKTSSPNGGEFHGDESHGIESIKNPLKKTKVDKNI